VSLNEKIEAIIRPGKFDEVKNALGNFGFKKRAPSRRRE
jgi:nitrogen regulatory protein PII